MQNGAILCEGVSKKYGELTALRSVDLAIERGEFLVLFGPNGAGKSTLMKIICGLTRPTTGRALVAGHDIHESDIRKKVGVISHKSFLYEDLTAFENLEFYARLYSVKNAGQRAEELLRQVELFDRKNDLARTFSRGMIQRLSIARALVADPDFIFLDEPFTGLDVHSATVFRDLLQILHKREKTVLMISHDIGISLSVATRIAILNAGKIVYNEQASGKDVSSMKKIYLEKLGL